ncbi:hypothetical protein JCM12178A_18300 [Salidesulfovibrio brasiliensis]
MLLPSVAHAYFSPDLEKFSAAEINEMLQSKRAKSKSDIKRLMEFKYVVPGGDAPSGLKLVTLDEWHPMWYRRKSGGVSGNTASVSDFNSVSYWDVETKQLKEVIVLEDEKYSIVGSNPTSPWLVIAKHDGQETEFRAKVEFASYDARTLDKKAEFQNDMILQCYNKGLFRAHTASWSQMDYAMSEEGKCFAATAGTGQFSTWLVETGRIMTSAKQEHKKTEFPYTSISPDGKRFFTKVGSEVTAVFDFETGKLLSKPSVNVVGTPSFSRDDKYLLLGKHIMTADGKKKICKLELPFNSFLPGTDLVITWWNTFAQYSIIDKDGSIEVAKQFFKGIASNGLAASVSSDGKYYFLTSCDSEEQRGPYTHTIVKAAPPTRDAIRFVEQGERAIELYTAGLKKQGIDKMRGLIKANPQLIWSMDYDKKLVAKGMPPILAAEMLIPVIRETIADKSNKKKGLAYKYSAFSLWALAARQPVAATQAYNAIVQDLNKKAYSLTPWGATKVILLHALSLKMMGKDNAAYDYLIAKGGQMDTFGKQSIKYMSYYPNIFRPLLKDRKKLAVILDVDEKKLPKSGKSLSKRDYLTLDGKELIGKAPDMKNQTVYSDDDSGKPAGKSKTKSKSVVLD